MPFAISSSHLDTCAHMWTQTALNQRALGSSPSAPPPFLNDYMVLAGAKRAPPLELLRTFNRISNAHWRVGWCAGWRRKR